ncbi:replicative DNA helicase [Promicromonospora sp. NPDC057488]|uniref:replicative DNA helicase n=1 Tax=Promicromonospora sp. NPDC057488 TaxID=3346147 RepID=UPI00366C2C74
MTDDLEGAPTEPGPEAPQSVKEVPRSEIAALYELIGPAFDAIDARASSPGKTPQDVVPTGFMDLDRVTGGGLAAASTTAVFGHSGMGSSVLALNFATHAATACDVPVLVVSWESDRDALVRRVLSHTAGVPLTRLTAGALDDDDWRKLAAAMGRIAETPLSMTAGPPTFEVLSARVSEWTATFPSQRRLLVLDGLPHLARLSPANTETSVWDAHTRISAQVKHLAMTELLIIVYTVPTIVDVMRRADPRPRLGDVAYSPAYVADADLVLGVYREDLVERESPRAGEADLHLLKSKHGPTDVFLLAFQGHFQRFVDVAL